MDYQRQPEPDHVRVMELAEFVSTTKPPVSEQACDVTSMTMGYIEWMVFQEKQGMPHVTFVKDGKLGILATQFIEDFKGDDKEAFAVAVKNLRKDCEVVCFGHEAWMAKIDKSQYATGKYVMPRLRPDRIEAGLVQVWIKGGRHVMFTAEIKRKPTRMEPWKISFDTAIDGDHIEGRFA